MKKVILHIVILSFFASCTNYTSNAVDSTKLFFGGNIENPKDSTVMLYSIHLKDTLYSTINNDNSFLFEIDSIKEGMYSFAHGNELQNIYLENGDSLMLRLNTTEFDESLVYTGIGAAVNNFLIDRFIRDETNVFDIAKFYTKEPKSFLEAIDSIKTKEIEVLNDFHYEGSGFSSSAYKFIINGINYSEYTFKEIYTRNHMIVNKLDSITVLPSNFYDYRINTDIDNESLINIPTYFNFVYFRLNNYTLDSIIKIIPVNKYIKKPSDYKDLYSTINSWYIKDKITYTPLKEKLFYINAINVFSEELSIEEVNTRLVPFFENVKNTKYISIINEKLSFYTKLQPKSIAPDFTVYNSEGDKKRISDYFGKPTYIMFWLSPSDYKLKLKTIEEFNALSEEFPNVQFLSVFLDYDFLWNSCKIDYGTENITQLRADYLSVKKKYLFTYFVSFVIIDKHGKIVNSNSCFPTSSTIREKLNAL